jgi:hypothetical protein
MGSTASSTRPASNSVASGLGLSLPTGIKLSMELDREIVRRIIAHSTLLQQAEDIAGKIVVGHQKLLSMNAASASAAGQADAQAGGSGAGAAGTTSSRANVNNAATRKAQNANSQSAAAEVLAGRVRAHVAGLISILLHLRLAALAVVEGIVAWRAVQHEMITARYIVKEATNASMPPAFQRLLAGAGAHGAANAGGKRRARFADGGVPGLTSPGDDEGSPADGDDDGGEGGDGGVGFGGRGRGGGARAASPDDDSITAGLDSGGSMELMATHELGAVFGASTALAAVAAEEGGVGAAGEAGAGAGESHGRPNAGSGSAPQPMSAFSRVLAEALRQIPVYTYGGADVLGSLATSLDFLAGVEPLVAHLGVAPSTLPLNPFMSPASLKIKAEALVQNSQPGGPPGGENAGGGAAPFSSSSSSSSSSSVALVPAPLSPPPRQKGGQGGEYGMMSPPPDPMHAAALASALQRPHAPASAAGGAGRRGRSALASQRPATGGLGLGLGDEDALATGANAPASAREGSARRMIPIRVTSGSPVAEVADAVDEEPEDEYDDDDFGYDGELAMGCVCVCEGGGVEND